MAGTYSVNQQETFSAVLLLSSSPKRRFGSQEQATNAAGTPQWSVEAAVTFSPVDGIVKGAEVVSVTIPSQHDPASGIAPGSAVNFEGLRLGVSGAEKTDSGRVRGGKPYFQATAVRAAHAAQRQPAKDAA